MTKSYLVIIFLIFFAKGFSQKDSIMTVRIDSVTINSSRLVESQLLLPIAVTKLNFETTQNSKQQLTLNDYLQEVPGLFVQNANNFSQDMRVSIRGFGSRSAFGIRGVKILVDGIPETTPDGQGQIDNLNLGIIKNIEVIRGPSATLYGNASGGVISITTLDVVEQPFIKTGLTAGSYNFQRYQVLSGIKGKKTAYLLEGNYTKTDGYRNQSGFANYNLNGRMIYRPSDKSKWNIHLNYTNSPKAEDAGGLTLEELKTNRRQARGRNVDFKTQESIQQFKLGTSFEYDFNKKKSFNSYGFFSNRSFNGKLPFEFGGIVDLNRNYFGNGSSLNFNSTKVKLQLGYDWAIQKDNRDRYRNLEGEQGDKTLDQLESFSTFGLYALSHVSFNKLLIRGGIRFDANKLKVDDEFLDNGDSSGSINLNAFNPSLGLNYSLNNNASIFTGFSTSFETPTLSELSSNPSNQGGFNENLKAQKANSFDLGFRLRNSKESFEAVIFYIKTINDLVPYELEAFPDRTFFRNAGRTIRKGLELTYSRDLSRSLRVSSTYTYSDFKYDSYSIPSGDFKGNALPVIPKHKGLLSVLYQYKKITAKLEGNYIGSLYANDANLIEIEDYTLVNLNLGYKTKVGKTELSPFLGINNLFNTTYNDNIRINAFGGRHYEAAPGFNVFGGLRVQW